MDKRLLSDEEREVVENPIEYRCYVLMKLKDLENLPRRVGKLEAWRAVHTGLLLTIIGSIVGFAIKVYALR